MQGIPAVKAFRDGRLVDQFTGALPRLSVETFLRTLLPSEADRLVEQGDADSIRRALELEPTHPGALAAMARLDLADDDAAAPGPAAIANGDVERGLQLLLEAIVAADGDLRDRLRQVMVGVFSDLGQDHPWPPSTGASWPARSTRRPARPGGGYQDVQGFATCPSASCSIGQSSNASASSCEHQEKASCSRGSSTGSPSGIWRRRW